MALEQILNYIEQHGLSLVLLVIMIVVWFAPWVKNLLKKDEALSRRVGDKSYHTPLLEDIVKLDTLINSVLSEIIIAEGAERTTILQFHNGIRSTAGVPFTKISSTHAQTKPNLPSNISLYSGMPLSIFAKELTILLETGFVCVSRGDQEHQAISDLIVSVKIGYVCFVPIKDARGCLFGVLAISFARKQETSPEELERYRGYGNRISILLSGLAFLTTGQKCLESKESSI